MAPHHSHSSLGLLARTLTLRIHQRPQVTIGMNLSAHILILLTIHNVLLPHHVVKLSFVNLAITRQMGIIHEMPLIPRDAEATGPPSVALANENLPSLVCFSPPENVATGKSSFSASMRAIPGP